MVWIVRECLYTLNFEPKILKGYHNSHIHVGLTIPIGGHLSVGNCRLSAELVSIPIIITGLYGENGKENGKYCIGFRV